MAECLEKLEPFVSPNQSFSESRRSEASAFSLQHLPPIRLPPFDGKYDEWESFRDRFTALIRDNKDLNDFAQMHFLSSCLKGPVLDCIENIPVTAANFDVTWNALVARYENKRRFLNVHLSTLLNLQAVTRESATEVRTLHDKVNVAVKSLSNLNRSSEELWSDALVHIISQKLDPCTYKAWSLKENDRDAPPSYDELTRFIQSQARALENLASGAASKTSAKPAALPRVQTATASADSPTKCLLCKAAHFINSCPTFIAKNPSQRRDVVKQYKRCFNCLSEKHVVQACKSKYSCQVCNKRHHSMLHSDSDSCSSSSNSVFPDCSPSQTTDTNSNVSSLHSSTAKGRRPQVLLATAWVTVSVSSGRTAIVRALLDQGSEMTFISENLVQTVRAKRYRLPTSVTAIEGIHAGTFRHGSQIFISPRDYLSFISYNSAQPWIAHFLCSKTTFRYLITLSFKRFVVG